MIKETLEAYSFIGVGRKRIFSTRRISNRRLKKKQQNKLKILVNTENLQETQMIWRRNSK